MTRVIVFGLLLWIPMLSSCGDKDQEPADQETVTLDSLKEETPETDTLFVSSVSISNPEWEDAWNLNTLFDGNNNSPITFSKGSGPGESFTIEFKDSVSVKHITLENQEADFEKVKWYTLIGDNVTYGVFAPGKKVLFGHKVKNLSFVINEVSGMNQVTYPTEDQYVTVVSFPKISAVAVPSVNISSDRFDLVYSLNEKPDRVEEVIKKRMSRKYDVQGSFVEDNLDTKLYNIVYKSEDTLVTEFQSEYDSIRFFSRSITPVLIRTFHVQSNGKMISVANWVGKSISTKRSVWHKFKNRPGSVMLKGIHGAIEFRKNTVYGPMVNLMYEPRHKNFFVNMGDYGEDFVYDMRYATDNNFLKKDVYDGCANCFLRIDAAEALLKAQKMFNQKGYKIKFFDCYRPHDIQKKMWEIFPHPGYVADPAKGSMHNRGAAVDMTLTTMQGDELDMGTGFDFFGPEAHHTYQGHSDTINGNRKLLKETMEAAGFRSIRTEWWHYSLVKPGGHTIANVPICFD